MDPAGPVAAAMAVRAEEEVAVAALDARHDEAVILLPVLAKCISMCSLTPTFYLQADPWHVQVSDVRSQLRFLEEIERLKKRRKDEEERETLLRLARVSFSAVDQNNLWRTSLFQHAWTRRHLKPRSSIHV